MKMSLSHIRTIAVLAIFVTSWLSLMLTRPAGAQDRGIQNDINKRPGATAYSRRVALVIGNSAYNTAPLKNPINDAQDIAQALRGLGFDVVLNENLNQNDMKRAIRAFGEKLRGGGVGLFYYAGHGVQVKGVNYLVPVDARIEGEEEVEYECVDAGFVLAQMEGAGNSLNIVILDACRNNPFARSFRSASRGLAVMNAPSGTLIAYATAPGSVASDGTARNGLYTQELLKFMRTPNLSIEEVFKRVRISVRNFTQGRQTPWEASSLTGDFYFSGSESATDAPLARPGTADTQPAARPSNNPGPNAQSQQLTGDIEKQPSADAYYSRGLDLSSQKNYRGAAANFTEAIRLNPNFAAAYYARAGCKSDYYDYQGAIEDYSQVIRLEPTNAAAYYARGLTKRHGLQDYRGAIEDYSQVIRLKPDDTAAYYARGLAKDSLGDKTGAYDDFRKACQMGYEAGCKAAK